MAPDVINLTPRDATAQSKETFGLSITMTKLLVALMVLLIISILFVSGLLIFRYRRRALHVRSVLPQYDSIINGRRSTSSVRSFHRRTYARPTSSIHVFREKQLFEEMSEAPPTSNKLPEIRITFPEEVDSTGKLQSGHVVVVRVGDTNYGLEPLKDDLPLYHDVDGAQFQSIDIECVGGLTEKESRPPLGWK